MIEKTINRLVRIIEKTPDLLRTIDESELTRKSSPNKWSKKEIIGHLIDSATNNHQRFIRGQFEINPVIQYDQNKWNEFNFYQEIKTKQLINFWTLYNKQLIQVIKRIPKEYLKHELNNGAKSMTLEYYIIDYVDHLEHHLKQLIECKI